MYEYRQIPHTNFSKRNRERERERKRERVKERERERERTETKKNFFRTTRQEFVFNITMIAGLKLTDQM